jgi:hypothetical protein
MEYMRARNWLSIGLAALLGLISGCGSTPPASQAGAPATPAAAAAPSQSPWPFAPSGPRLAARDPALDRWKRAAAERIHEKNRDLLFEGRPHHLLQAVSSSKGLSTRTGTSPGRGSCVRLASHR